MRGRGALIAAMMVSSFALAIPAQALATQYWASPGGAGGPCTQAMPCSLSTASNDAVASGDEVVITPGDYTLNSAYIVIRAGVSAHGQAGMPRPRLLFSGGYDMYTSGTGAALSDLYIESSSARALELENATGDRLFVKDTASSGSPCWVIEAGSSTLRDSVCEATGANGVALNVGNSAKAITAELRNDTLVAPDPAGQGIVAVSDGAGGSTMVAATNVIARGGQQDVAALDYLPGDTATVTMSYSNYDPAHTLTSGVGAVVDNGHNQSAPPVFVSAATDNFHEALTSGSTIDRGLTDPANGSSDLDGNPRALGASTDIGAYEFQPSPIVSVAPGTAITPTAATLNGTVTPEGSAATVTFRYGPTTSYGSSSSPQTLAASTNPRSVSAAVTGLAPSTTYHAQLVATNSSGTSISPDFTFTTSASPAGPGKFVLGRVTPGKDGSISITGTCSTAGRVSATGTYPAPARSAAARTKKRHRSRPTVKRFGDAATRTQTGGVCTLRVKPTRATAKLLRTGRVLTVTVKVTFTPTTGAATTATTTVRDSLKKRHPTKKRRTN